MIILYAFLSLSQLRRSWFSSVCVSVCLCVCTPARANLWKCSLEAARSLSVSSYTSIFCVQRSAFSATTRCTVQSVSLTKHDQDNKKKIINANLPNSAFVFFCSRFSFFVTVCCFVFVCVCKRYSTHVTLSLCCTVLNGPYLSFFFVLLNVSFFFLYCFSLFLNFCPSSPSIGDDGAKLLKI